MQGYHMHFPYKEVYHFEKGFEEYLNKNIGPLLLQVERHRKDSLKKFIGVLLVCLVLLVLVLISFLEFEDLELPLFMLVAWFILTFGALGHIRGSFRNTAKSKINKILVKFFGDFTYKHGCGIEERVIDHLDLIIPDYDYIDYDDYICGTYGNNRIHFCEANVKEEYEDSEGDTHTKSVFRGLFIVINVKSNFTGKTFVVKDRGTILNYFRKFSTDYTRVSSLKNKEFEVRFETYSNCPAETKKLLTPSFQKKMLQLSKNFGVSALNCCFIGNEVIFAIPIKKDLYEPVSLFKTAYSEYKYKCFLRDFQLVLDLSEDMSYYFETQNTQKKQAQQTSQRKTD